MLLGTLGIAAGVNIVHQKMSHVIASNLLQNFD